MERFVEIRKAFSGRLAPIIHEPDNTGLPRYIPQIYGSCRREELLDAPWAAIPLYRLVGYKKTRGYSRLIDNRTDFDERFMLRRDAGLIAVGSNFDQKLENFWEHLDSLGEMTPLTFLGIRLVTSPNYSFFLDMLEPTRLYNFGRIVLATEAIQAAGFTPVPHLNAITHSDWNRWHSYLKGQPQIRFVAKEFGTGLQSPRIGPAAIRNLAELRDRLGRDLHLIAIGGGRFTPYIAHFFPKFTIVDSDAYMKTMRWQEARVDRDERLQWERFESEPDGPLHRLLAHNIDVMRSYIEILKRRKSQIPNSSDASALMQLVA